MNIEWMDLYVLPLCVDVGWKAPKEREKWLDASVVGSSLPAPLSPRHTI